MDTSHVRGQFYLNSYITRSGIGWSSSRYEIAKELATRVTGCGNQNVRGVAYRVISKRGVIGDRDYSHNIGQRRIRRGKRTVISKRPSWCRREQYQVHIGRLSSLVEYLNPKYLSLVGSEITGSVEG